MRRAFGPLLVEAAGDVRGLVVYERLFERAAPVASDEERDTIVVEFRVCAPDTDISGEPHFFVGETRGFVTGPHAYRLVGHNRSVRVEPGRVSVSLRADALGDDRQIEEIALVDLACAVFLAARAYGLWHVHAACVVLPDGAAVVIAGQSGSGKSTTTLLLLQAGARWLADDTVLLRVQRDGVLVYGVPRMFHVTTTTLRNLPMLAAAVVPGRTSLLGKLCLDPVVAFPDAYEPGPVRPTHLVLPRVSGRRTVASPAHGADALGALIEASAWVTVDELVDAGEHLAALVALCDQAKCVEVSLAVDIFAAPDLLRESLVEPGGESA